MIAIVIVNWNGSRDTVACLQSLVAMDLANVIIVVCDNGSVDDSCHTIPLWMKAQFGPDFIHRYGVSPHLEKVKQNTYRAIFAEIGENLGFAGANNVGTRLAVETSELEFIWYLNNDTIVEPDALEWLRDRMLKDRAIGICGSTLVYEHDRRTVQSLGTQFNVLTGKGRQLGWGVPVDHLPERAVVEAAINYVPGASMLVSRSFIETIGLMNESYFLYFEEIDWSIRSAGRFKLGWAPRSIVYHKEGASIGTKSGGRSSDTSIYYMNVNYMRLIATYKPLYTPVAMLRSIFITLRFIVNRDRRGARMTWLAVSDFFLKRHRKGSGWIHREAR